jgi:D-alanine-D-alanine ligase
MDRVAFRGNGGKIVDTIESTLGYPIFIKPANMGSSVGVTKVLRREEIEPALTEAFKFDAKAICEQGIIGRELECSVLGNLKPEAAEVGEIIPTEGFYDYKAKYITDDAELVIPADIPPAIREEVREKAVRSFLVHDCRGLARVDFFYVEEKGQILVSELNTMPGFTPISMYPKLWDAIGLPYPELIDRLIELAFERAEEKAQNVVGYDEAVDV